LAWLRRNQELVAVGVDHLMRKVKAKKATKKKRLLVELV